MRLFHLKDEEAEVNNCARSLLVATGVAMASSSAMAEGFYAAVDGGQTKGVDVCSGAGLFGVAGCKDTATAWRVAGGYQFTPNWGAEVSYADYGSADLGMTTVPITFLGRTLPAGTALGQWKAYGFVVSGTGALPLGGGFSLFLKAGVASTRLELTVGTGPSATKTTFADGIGAQYDVNPNLAIRAQYEDFGNIGDPNVTGKTKLRLLSAGLVVKF